MWLYSHNFTLIVDLRSFVGASLEDLVTDADDKLFNLILYSKQHALHSIHSHRRSLPSACQQSWAVVRRRTEASICLQTANAGNDPTTVDDWRTPWRCQQQWTLLCWPTEWLADMSYSIRRYFCWWSNTYQFWMLHHTFHWQLAWCCMPYECTSADNACYIPARDSVASSVISEIWMLFRCKRKLEYISRRGSGQISTQ